MEKNIFRKSSLDRISSPEQLTDYIRVTNPSVWVILIAVAILLISVLIWSIFGVLPDTLKVNAMVQDGRAICYVDEGTASKLDAGMPIQVGETSGIITGVSTLPVSAARLGEEIPDDFVLSRLITGEWNFPVQAEVPGLEDGLYEMVITIDNIKPISFLWN